MRTYLPLLLILFICAGCSHTSVKPHKTAGQAFSAVLSSPTPTSLNRDADGMLWIGTQHGLNIFDGHSYQIFTHEANSESSLPSSEVNRIFRDRDDQMWVCTSQGICVNTGLGQFKSYPTNASTHNAQCLFQDAQGRMLAIYGNELCMLRTDSFQRVLRLPFSVNSRPRQADIYQSGDGRLVINDGIFVLSCDSAFRRLSYLSMTPTDYRSAANDKIIVITSLTSGLTVYDKRNLKVLHHDPDAVRFVVDQLLFYKDKLLISTDEGLYGLGLNDYKLQKMPAQVQDNIDYRSLETLFADRKGNLWAGYFQKGFRRIDINSQNYAQSESERLTRLLPAQRIASLVSDGRQHLMGAMLNDSLFFFNAHTNQLSTYSLEDFMPIHSRQHILYTGFSAQRFWVVTTSHVFCLHAADGLRLDYFYDEGLNERSTQKQALATPVGIEVMLDNGGVIITDALHRGSYVNKLFKASANVAPIVSERGDVATRALSRPVLASKLPNGIQPICRTVVSGRNFVGTSGGLYSFAGGGKAVAVKTVSPHPVTNVVALGNRLTYTQDNRVWLLSPDTQTSLCIWQASTGEPIQDNSLCALDQSKLICLASKQLRQIDLASMQKSSQPFQLIIQDVIVDGNDSLRLQCGLSQVNADTRVILSHNQNSFKLHFAAIDHGLTGAYTYRYRLKGAENTWHDDGQGEASYNLLPPGNYTFEVRAQSRLHPQSVRTATVRIRVLPHPLLSAWAWMAYAAIALLLVYYINHLYLRIHVERLNANAAEESRRQAHHINEMNMHFFANISHEFRNPIAMISGPVDVLRKDKELSKNSQNMVKLISQSSTILLRLINQMLDFNKLEDDALRLSVEEADVVDFVEGPVSHFEVSAAEKGITITRRGMDAPIIAIVDLDKIGKTTDNLLRNAILHTPQGGTIEIAMGREADNFYIRVTNTGERIPDEALPDIFKRYYMATSKAADWGAGIGLHYVRSLVELHHGSIKAENTDQGVSFTMRFPTAPDAYKDSEWAHRQLEQSEQYSQTDEIPRGQRHDEDTAITAEGKPKMVIAESDVNIAYFLRKLFEEQFVVYNRYDTVKAYDTATSVMPDIILCEVGKDKSASFEFCKSIKQNETTADIVWIFLASDTSPDNQVSGMEAGADTYLIRPFATDYLLQVVANLVTRRQRWTELKQQVGIASQQDSKQDISAKDKLFLKQLDKFIEQHLTDGDLDIARLVRTTLVSRAKLYALVKSLTGCTPNEYFRNYKLDKAAVMLKTGRKTVSEVSDECGFSSIAYFSRTFKKRFGVSPKDYS